MTQCQILYLYTKYMYCYYQCNMHLQLFNNSLPKVNCMYNNNDVMSVRLILLIMIYDE